MKKSLRNRKAMGIQLYYLFYLRIIKSSGEIQILKGRNINVSGKNT